ncbi:nucleoporin 155 [Actinidia rufa]|uniref:Nucleoporin 155 n=1 Tax=Actinidia rufa TaxID=165716 RepID=A0A7J0GYH1_9ERIC|nr:nucleoporin 155 [Actinidia rufa]
MSSENEIVLRDVTNACLVVSDRIGRDVAAQLDLEEALEASRYASHPYSTHPREVVYSLLILLLTKGCLVAEKDE